jgi:hypothetical protein
VIHEELNRAKLHSVNPIKKDQVKVARHKKLKLDSAKYNEEQKKLE